MLPIQAHIFILSAFFNYNYAFSIHNEMNEPELAYYFNTVDKEGVPDYQLVYLPQFEAVTEDVDDENEFDYGFSAFDSPINLRLKRNRNLLSPAFKTYLFDGNDVPSTLKSYRDCHFLHKDNQITASISACGKNTLQGLLFLQNTTLEIHPLNERLLNVIRKKRDLNENSIPHIIKRASFDKNFEYDEVFPTNNLYNYYKTNYKSNDLNPKYGNRNLMEQLKSLKEKRQKNYSKNNPYAYKNYNDKLQNALNENNFENKQNTENIEDVFENNNKNYYEEKDENKDDQNDDYVYFKNANEEQNLENVFLKTYKIITKKSKGRLTLEIALFFDEPAYKIFAPYFKYDDIKLRDMILAYVNGVQALYHHPSLGTSLELVLVRLDIMKRQPVDMKHYEGERSMLLDSFCAYQSSLNSKDDKNPHHWDMGLYISGLDFFAYENGRKSGVTMGLATVGGVCLNKYACIIAELGTTNVFGKPYPSAGFTSVYILAHEIGHNLGMHHDSVTNSCPKDGYVMSPSRGTNGETQWSSCSAKIMANLDWAKCLKDSGKPGQDMNHNKFQDIPGRTFTAKKQCEILLRDKDAIMSPGQQLDTICYNLQCKTPHRSGYYHAGPALDGTECGRRKYCYGGECTTNTPPKPVEIIPGGWGPWKEGECMSDCVENSKGHSKRRRLCNNPIPVNTDEGCEGPSYDIALCDDNRVCSHFPRKNVDTYASEKCKEFGLLITDLDPRGVGLQAPHEEGRIWTGCAVFCKKRDSGSFYTPRLELNDLGISPYFPDGTWCHRENGQDYYCLQHHCLPENFKISKDTLTKGFADDLQILQNARPHSIIPQDLQSYFSLDEDGKPVQTVLKPSFNKPPNEEDWETNDYIELPDIKLNEIL